MDRRLEGKGGTDDERQVGVESEKGAEIFGDFFCGGHGGRSGFLRRKASFVQQLDLKA